jgi:quinolinate synthase
MLPDKYLAQNVAAQTKVKIIAWHGACEVHERFTAEEIQSYRADNPGVKIIAHPECPREVVEISDFAGSTAAMIDYVRNKKPARVLLVTECSMADNVAAETTGTEFIRPCNFCPHMKRITLPKILDSLIYMREEVLVDPLLAERARASVQRMIDVG